MTNEKKKTFADRHPVLAKALSFSAVVSLLISCVGQSFVPAIAKVPGFLICGGDSFELILRRRTSYGVCGSGTNIHFMIVLVVSFLFWGLVSSPLAYAYAKRVARQKNTN